jgi:hypothetical protein
VFVALNIFNICLIALIHTLAMFVAVNTFDTSLIAFTALVHTLLFQARVFVAVNTFHISPLPLLL